MLNIFNKIINTEKKIIYALKGLFGISLYNSKKICESIGINPNTKLKYLDSDFINNIIIYIEKNLIIEQDLIKKLIFFKTNIINIKTVRGLRNLAGLPVRGQRTHSNNKTKRKLKNKI